MPCSILIVEDNASIRQMYYYALEVTGFAVSSASNGQEGLEKIQIHKPDLILLDIKMPVMNGDEMLRQLRADSELAHIKVFILTNLSKDEAPSSLRPLGVDRYIVKAHHTPRQVVEMIHETLGNET